MLECVLYTLRFTSAKVCTTNCEEYEGHTKLMRMILFTIEIVQATQVLGSEDHSEHSHVASSNGVSMKMSVSAIVSRYTRGNLRCKGCIIFRFHDELVTLANLY